MGSRPRCRAPHVLVVDDSRAQRHMLSMQLKRWGYRVSDSDSALAALGICATQDIDIVISDWMMPGLTGLEFCRRFRNLGRENYGYFILLTSKSEKTEIADGLEAGADDFLAKPVSATNFAPGCGQGSGCWPCRPNCWPRTGSSPSTLAALQEAV
jgi:phosphoserine phosphatase RsbU/P